jgi:hypothetical protein
MQRRELGMGHPPHAAQTLDRLPSPELSSQDLSPQSLAPASSTVLQNLDSLREQHHQNLQNLQCLTPSSRLDLEPKGNHILEEIYQLRQVEKLETPESVYPGALPQNFFSKLAEMMAFDQEIQNRILEGETRFFTGRSRRALFLQACAKGDDKEADSAWQAIGMWDKQELLLAYSCGPPSSDFFVNLMSSNDTTSDYKRELVQEGSSSTEFESGSDITTTSDTRRAEIFDARHLYF